MRTLFVLFILLGTVTLNAQSTDPYPPSPVPDRVMLTLYGDPSTTMAVTWRTDVSVNRAWAEIALATADSSMVYKADTLAAKREMYPSNRNVANYFSVVFKDLTPNTQYAYRVGNGDHYSEWFHFTTAKTKTEDEAFSFVYFGDAQNEVRSLWSRCIRQAVIGVPEFDFFLHAGDMINIANRDEEWGEWFHGGGWIFGMKPSIATPGNHEYWRDGDDRRISKHWRPTFTLPENGVEGLEESVYFVDYQDTRFISLNSPDALRYPESRAKQAEWLRGVLEDNPNKWTIVTHHHPIYSTAAGRDNVDLRAAFQPLYEEFGVDLVLQGHDHTYGRGYNVEYGETHKDKGPIYVVSVSGPKMYNLNFESWLTRVASNTQLYQWIKVEDDELTYRAYTTTGDLYDGFTLKKKKNGNRFVDEAPEKVPERAEPASRSRYRMNDEAIQLHRQRFEAYKARNKDN